MRILKFGGTSIGKPEKMQQVAQLVAETDEQCIVVISALNGTTNALVEICNGLANNERKRAKVNMDKLEAYYHTFTDELLKSASAKIKGKELVKEHFDFLNVILKISFSQALQNDILAQGELLSSKLFSLCLEEKQTPHVVLPAFDFMQINANNEPLIGNIKVNLSQLINEHKEINLFITQGSICRNHRAEMDNLGRGGSDYSASLIAAAMEANVCEIWTDIEGLRSNDPLQVEGTVPVARLSFDEAAEVAYFSEKILHPASIWPARSFNIPVKLKNTLRPQDNGTLITGETIRKGIKAIVSKDGIIAIKIQSNRMLLAYGFLRKVFDVFEVNKTPIDLVTTSEVSISVTIDNKDSLVNIVHELQPLGSVEVEDEQSIISLVGNDILSTPDILLRTFSALKNIPVRMISYGGSNNNITLLVAQQNKPFVLKALHEAFMME